MPNLSQELLKYLKNSLEEIRNIYSIFMQNINLLSLNPEIESNIRYLNQQAMLYDKKISDNPHFVRSLIKPTGNSDSNLPVDPDLEANIRLFCNLTEFIEQSTEVMKSNLFFVKSDPKALLEELSAEHFKVIVDLAEPFNKLKIFIENLNKDIVGLEHAKQQLRQHHTFEEKDVENCFITLLKILPSLIETCDRFINIYNRFHVDTK